MDYNLCSAVGIWQEFDYSTIRKRRHTSHKVMLLYIGRDNRSKPPSEDENYTINKDNLCLNHFAQGKKTFRFILSLTLIMWAWGLYWIEKKKLIKKININISSLVAPKFSSVRSGRERKWDWARINSPCLTIMLSFLVQFNTSGRTMVLRSNQPLTETTYRSIRDFFLVKLNFFRYRVRKAIIRGLDTK
jgi:hypothetical protein